MAGVPLSPVARAVVSNPYVRLKASFNSILLGSVAASAALHFVFLSTASFDALPDYSVHGGPLLEQMEIERKYELPPPPEQIARPAIPVLATDVSVSEEITIGSVLIRDNPVEMLPPPPSTSVAVDASAQPTFTPYEVKPELKNGPEVRQALERGYPKLLRDAGIGGVVVLWVYIDERGEVRNARVVQASAHPELDAVAEQVVRASARFSPAYNRDVRVPVWIQIPVEFEPRTDG